MAFEFIRSENSASPIEKELIATSGTTYKHGVAIKYSDAGKAAVASGTTKPEYIYVGKDVVGVSGAKIACVPVLPEYEFESQFSTVATSIKEGEKVTISSDGLGVTATKTSGEFQLLEPGKASGATIRGRFA